MNYHMTNLKNKTLSILNKNTDNYNNLKAIEELNELATILTQKLTKPLKVKNQDIIDEIGDVKIRLWYLENKYGKEKVQKRMINKIGKLNKKLC